MEEHKYSVGLTLTEGNRTVTYGFGAETCHDRNGRLLTYLREEFGKESFENILHEMGYYVPGGVQ